MRTRVSVIVVAQSGGEWLDRTLDAIHEQEPAPGQVIVVNNGGGSPIGTQLASRTGIDQIVDMPQRQAFGQAVQQGVLAVPREFAKMHAGEARSANAERAHHGDSGDGGATGGGSAEDLASDWYWLLAEDSAPEPGALKAIMQAVQRSPSVAVAGPKLVDWDHPNRIIEIGQSLTRTGTRWRLQRQELDQQQYDHYQDVLGVGPVGMLVRADVWKDLDGFDPAYPVIDDGLDFSVRARLAGHRVEVAPASRVRFAQSGVAGPRIDRPRAVMRAAHRQARTAQLHRRIAYAPAAIAWAEWLFLPVLAVIRMAWALIREQPGHLWGEFASAFSVFFRPGSIIASRRRIKRASKVGWEAIRNLRVDPKTVRTARIVDREAILAEQGRHHRELQFISAGGLAVVVAASVIALVLMWWVFSYTSLFGGALAPLSSLDELWWNTRSLDGVPADPFVWVLALLGTLTPWNPSHAVVLFLALSIPLTALGTWVWTSNISISRAGRALAALAFAASPVLLASIASGRITTVVLITALPWLLLTGARVRESWSYAATTSLLAGLVLASAPVLIPMAIIAWIVGLCASWRGIAKAAATAIVPVVLFAPKIIDSLVSRHELELLLDPGVVLPYEPGSTWHQLLGFPEFGLAGWADILQAIGAGGPPATLLVGVLVAPLAALALFGLLTGRLWVTVMMTLTGGLGFATAIAASLLGIATVGDETVALWCGSGLAVYWLAVVSLASVGADSLKWGATPVVAVALVGALIAVLPLGVKLTVQDTPLRPGSEQMPALVQATGEQDPDVRTLSLTALGPNAVRAELVTGAGLRLDEIRTATSIPEATEQDTQIVELVSVLASTGTNEAAAVLRSARVSYVLLHEGGEPGERSDLQRTFDQHLALESAGVTNQGLLWRVAELTDAPEDPGDATQAVSGTSFTGQTIWVVQLIVLLALALLALPTGEVRWRPERRKKPKRRRGAVTESAAHETEEATSQPAASPDEGVEARDD